MINLKRVLMLVAILIVSANMAVMAASFKIVVNESNPATSITKTELSKIFLKKTSTWSNKSQAYPVDLQKDSAVREQFTKDVLGKKVSSVNSYWQQKIFSGTAVPAPEKSSDAEVISYVKSNSGAVGYISATASTAGLKVLKIN